MRHPRYIIHKPKDEVFEDEEQEDYERASEYFVTSQTTEVPDDYEPGALSKVRFGIDHFFPQNFEVLSGNDGMAVGVPVHDACWKIFERVSKSKLGEVDLQGFMALWHVCLHPSKLLFYKTDEYLETSLFAMWVWWEEA